MPKLLIDEANELLVDVDPGKSKHVYKSGNVCTYYAENWLRLRHKQENYEETSPERQIEKFHSAVRKKITLSADIYSELSEFFKSFSDPLTKNDLIELKEAAAMMEQQIKENGQGFRENPHWPHLLIELKKYMQIASNKKMSRIEILSQLYEEKKARDIHIYEEALKERNTPFKAFLENRDKLSALHTMYVQMRREDYQLKPSKWNIQDDFDKLLREIRTKGPQLAQGHFGRYCYKKPPRKSSILNKVLFEFDESSYRKTDEDNLQAHAIILVGGKRTPEGKEILYYRDPLDKHTEKNPSPHYAIEFNAFKTRCVDTYGFEVLFASQTCLFFSSKYKNTEFSINHYNSPLNYGPENFYKR